MSFKDYFRRLTRQENLPIFLVLVAMIVVVYLVELFGSETGMSPKWRSSSR